MDKSTKNVVLGAVISGVFLIIASLIETYPSSINFDENKLSKDFTILFTENSLGTEIDKIKENCKKNIFYDYDIARSYIIDSQNILGGWSGSYIGTSNNKKREKSIQLYVGDCDHIGKVQGIAQIEDGKAGYYYWEGYLDFYRGIFSFERKKWLSSNPDHLKKIKYNMTYNEKNNSFNGYITNDPKRTIQLSKTMDDNSLKKYWEKRSILIEMFN